MDPQSTPNVIKSRKSQPTHEKNNFLKMSTSRTRNTHFQGSRVPKTLPKSTKNAPKVPQKSHRCLHRLLVCSFLILAPCWDTLGLYLGAKIAKKRAMLKGTRGSWRKLRAQGAQGRHQTRSKPCCLHFGSILAPTSNRNSSRLGTDFLFHRFSLWLSLIFHSARPSILVFL